MPTTISHRVAIIGGGNAGISVPRDYATPG